MNQRCKNCAKFGGYAQLPLFFQTSLQAEVYYVQKSAKIDFVRHDQKRVDQVNVTLGYLEAPIMFRMDFGKRSVRPFLMGGPSIGARFSCSNDTKIVSTPNPRACNSSAIPSDGDRYARTDLSAIGAIGVEFHRPRYDFGMQVRGNGAGRTLSIDTVQRNYSTACSAKNWRALSTHSRRTALARCAPLASTKAPAWPSCVKSSAVL